MPNLLYSWSFNSKKDRGSLWYIIVLSITVGLIIWWFLSKQYWMSFVIIILTWFIFYIENNSNDTININITNTWVKVDSNFYPFSNISSYTIIYEQDNAVLLRISIGSKLWVRNIDINIDNNIAPEVKGVLGNFLEENSREQLSFTEKVIRLLKL
jgi:hypothetical protein